MDADGGMMSEERMQVLNMVEAGQISPDEAVQLFDALNGAEPAPKGDTVGEPPSSPPDLSHLENGWLYLVAAGAAVMALGAPLVALGLDGRAALFWVLLCGWAPFFTGLAILTLGAWSRNARWFHLRISRSRGRTGSLALSFPLPLTLTAWVLGILRLLWPQFKETGIDEAVLALRDGLEDEDDQPVYIDVLDGEDGEHVQLYIG
jgi:hypothetical protein